MPGGAGFSLIRPQIGLVNEQHRIGRQVPRSTHL